MAKLKEVVKAARKRKVHLSLSTAAFDKLQKAAANNKVTMSRIVEHLVLHEIRP
jgi:hypothetical protein